MSMASGRDRHGPSTVTPTHSTGSSVLGDSSQHISLPIDHNLPAVAAAAADQLRLLASVTIDDLIPARTREALTAFSEAHKVTTPFAPLLACYATLIARYARCDRFAVGAVLPGNEAVVLDGSPAADDASDRVDIASSSAGRNRMVESNVTVVNVPLDVRRRESFASLSERSELKVQVAFQRYQESLSGQFYYALMLLTIELLLSLLTTGGIIDLTSSSAATSATLLLAVQMDTTEDWSSLLNASTSTLPSCQFALHLDLDTGAATAVYDASRLRDSTASRMLIHFRCLLESAMADPVRTPVARLPILTDVERARQVGEWSRPIATSISRDRYAKPASLTAAFEEVVARLPYRPCLVEDLRAVPTAAHGPTPPTTPPSTPARPIGFNGMAATATSRPLTYVALNRAANKLARYLSSPRVGVRRSQSVAVRAVSAGVSRVGFLTATLAVLKLGAVVVPLGAEFPAAWEGDVVRVAETGVWIICGDEEGVDGAHATRGLEGNGVKVIKLGVVMRDVEAMDDSNLDVVVDPSAVAYRVLLGAQVTHISLWSQAMWHRDFTSLTDRDRLATAAVLSSHQHAASVWSTLLVGASLEDLDPIAPSQTRAGAATTAMEPFAVLHLPSADWRALVDAWDDEDAIPPWYAARGSKVRHTLVTVASGEAACSEWMLAAAAATGVTESTRPLVLRPPVGYAGSVAAVYGPAECAAFATFTTGASLEEGDGAVGRAVSGALVYVLDAEMQPVPVGVVGEVYIGGDVVGRGYKSNHSMTASKFVRNPFASSSASQATLFRTCDLAVQSAKSGQVRIVGTRRSGSFKPIRVAGAFLVDAGEIEEHVASVTGVDACFVVTLRGVLVAVVVPRDVSQHPVDTAPIMHLLKSYPKPLAPFMTPTLLYAARNVVEAQSLVRDPALLAILLRPETPAPERLPTPSPTPTAPFQAPSPTPVNTAHAAKSGTPTNSFVTADAATPTRHTPPPPGSSSPCPTPSEVTVTPSAAAKPIPPTGPRAPLQPAFLPAVYDPTDPGRSYRRSPFEFALLSTRDAASGGRRSHNAGPMVVLEAFWDGFKQSRLTRALEAVSRRHVVLRRVADGAGTGVKVDFAGTVEIGRADVLVEEGGRKGRRGAARWEEGTVRRVRDAVGRWAREPKGVCVRGLVVEFLERAEEGEVEIVGRWVVVGFEAGVVDSWSISMFMSELRTAYQRLSQSLTAFPGHDPPRQHVDFAAWHVDHCASPLVWDVQMEFWRDRLVNVDGVVARILPDREGKVDEQSFGALKFEVDKYLVAKIRDFGRKFKCTVNQTFLVALYALLHIWSPMADPKQKRSILIAQPASLRRTKESLTIMGPMTNPVLIPVSVDPRTTTLADVISQVRRNILDAIDNADVPFQNVLDELKASATDSGAAIEPQWLFELVPTAIGGSEDASKLLKGGLAKIHADDATPTPAVAKPFDIMLTLEEETAGKATATGAAAMTGRITFRSDRFERETVWAIVGEFLRVCEEVVEMEGASVFGDLAAGDRIGVRRGKGALRDAATDEDHGDGLNAWVLELMREVVDRPNFGMDDDFFTAGGNTMLAIQVTHKIYHRYGLSLTLNELLGDAPTAASISKRIRDALAAVSAADGASSVATSAVTRRTTRSSTVNPFADHSSMAIGAYKAVPRASLTRDSVASHLPTSPTKQERDNSLTIQTIASRRLRASFDTAASPTAPTGDEALKKVLGALRYALGKADLQPLDLLKEAGMTPQVAADAANRIFNALGVKVTVFGASNAMEVARRVRDADGGMSSASTNLLPLGRNGSGSISNVIEEDAEEYLEGGPLPREAVTLKSPTAISVSGSGFPALKPRRAPSTSHDIQSARSQSIQFATSILDAAFSPIMTRNFSLDDTQSNTSGSQARALIDRSATPVAASIPRIYNPSDYNRLYPLSPLIASLYHPKCLPRINLNHPVVVRLRGRAPTSVANLMKPLRSALNIVTRRHPVLRSLLTSPTPNSTTRSHLRIDLTPSRRVEVEIVPVSVASCDANNPTTAAAIRRVILSKPFDDGIREELPLRVAVVSPAGPLVTDLVLCFVFNTALVDPACARVVVKEVLQVLDDLCDDDGTGAGLAALAYADEDPSFVDWMCWMEGLAATARPPWAKQMEFWESRLENVPVGPKKSSGLPGFNMSTVETTPVKDLRKVVRVEVGLDIAAGVAALCKSRKLSNSEVMMGCLVALLMRYHAPAGTDEVVVGSLSRKRPVGLERVVGRFENLVGLRCKVPGGCAASFMDVVAVVRKSGLEAYEHTDVPLDVIHQMLGRSSPIVEVALVHNKSKLRPRTLTSTGFLAEELEVFGTSPVASVDLIFVLDDDPLTGLTLTADYNSDALSRSTVDVMTLQYVRLLEAMVGNPLAAIGDAAILVRPEMDTVVKTFNAVATPRPSSARESHRDLDSIARRRRRGEKCCFL
ncbi:hypothetical protein HK101_002791 [Irineochytrium annulatum]|nr:hypothetical protein HK101_002791 [Irineochytrium annulatum]